MTTSQNPLSMQGTSEWIDYKWQQKNALRSSADIRKFFPNFPQGEIDQIAVYEQTRKWSITPYTLSLMNTYTNGNPFPKDPLVSQFFPVRGFCLDDAVDSYDGKTSNWEHSEEMPTPILHHKYPHKVILRVANHCLGYCGFCFEVARTEDKTSDIGFSDASKSVWDRTLDYLRQHQEVREAIISGGDPLLLPTDTLERKIEDLSGISHIRAIRIHTRALTFNPYRFDDSFCRMAAKYHKLGAYGFHFTHPNEITDDAWRAITRLDREVTTHERGTSTIKFAMIPLLKGINDDTRTLEELFMSLYENGIKPYYLIHCFPGIQGANQFRTSVRKGVDLMLQLKRRISNVAMPEYIIPHNTGKHTVPLEKNGTPEFEYHSRDDSGNPFIVFKNWKGNWQIYRDHIE